MLKASCDRSSSHPLYVTQVLAEVLQGRCFPFPAHAGSYITVVDDGFGTAIELYPADVQLIPDSEEVGFSTGNLPQVFSSAHAAISVSASQAQIEAIAHREGWLVRFCGTLKQRTGSEVPPIWGFGGRFARGWG